jgi:DNA-binding NarL/FixJ family response regulator
VQSDAALKGQAKRRGTNPGASHGARWLPSEEEALARMHRAGRSVEEMGRHIGRSDGGVRSRLRLLGLAK